MSKAKRAERLFIDQVSQLTEQLIPATSASLINSFILSFVLWNMVDNNNIILWFLCVLTIFLIHFLLHRKYQRLTSNLKKIIHQRDSIVISLAVTGIIWGAAGVFLFPVASIGHQSFIAFVLGGMVAGSVGSFSIFKSAFLAFSLPALLPIIIMFLKTNDAMHFSMGTMIALFWFIMFITAGRLNKELINSLNLKHENLDLILNLENEITERKKAEQNLLIKNQQIEEIVQERTSELQTSNKNLIMEIDERKQVEKALHESREKYRNLANTLPQIVFEADGQGNLTFVNPIAFDFFGYAQNDFDRGLNIFQVIKDEDHDRVTTHIQQLQNGLTLNGNEYRALRKDGTTFPIAVHAGPIISGNKFTGFNGIVIDLREKKAAEEAKNKLETHLQQSQKMDAIGMLAGGIAHDFNNILAAIIGYTELSMDETEEGSAIKDNLNEIFTAGNRAKELVNQILAFARQSDEKLQPLRVDKIIKEVLKFIRSSIPATIEIRQNIASDSLIVGNSGQVHQIMMNLCTNAAYAMEDNGGILEVTLKDIIIDPASDLESQGLKPGNYMELTISDTGTGISPDIIKSIFIPFFTTKPIGEGSGMGLSVVHGIIESYGGKITVDSQLGEGTVFTIYLPITKKRISSLSLEPEAIPTGTERILFIDDEAPIAQMAGTILKRLGYHVTTSTSSVDALDLFRMKPNDFDLIITDMTMPIMTGDYLAVELMEIRPDIPIILCTGYSKKISDETAKDIGIKAFAYKPIVKANLAKTIRRVLDEAKNRAQHFSKSNFA